MPEPEKHSFNPFTAAKAAVSSATRQVVNRGKLDPGQEQDAKAKKAASVDVPVDKPERPVLAPRLRGLSLLVSNRLPSLSMGRASAISTGLHVLGPFVLTLLVVVTMLILSWLLHFNFWDLFKPKAPQDMTFTLVDNVQTKRPEHPIFKGNANQHAGGKQHHQQPPNPGKEANTQPKAKAAKSEPAPKSQAQPPKPAQKAVAPKPAEQPAPEPPKPQAQKQPTPPDSNPTPTIATPTKTPKPDALKPDTPKAQTQPPKAQTQISKSGSAPEPIEVSTRTTDFGISTSPPDSAASGNPQDGKAKDPGVDVAQDVDYGAFMADLQKRISRNWIPPRGQESRKVVLLFYVGRDGRLIKVDVKKSSGEPDVDRAAIEAVQVSSPFTSVPPQMKEDVLPVEFTFDYNVLNPKNAKKALKW